MPASLSRIALFAALAALALASTGAGALDAGPGVRFASAPTKVLLGQRAFFSVVVTPTGTRCTAAVTYAGGKQRQALGPVVARAGKASWRWRVRSDAPRGKATATVACNRAGRATRSFVVAAPATAPASVDVRKSGFSQRVRSTRREVSYGIVLHNPSPENDALGVVVLVNFIGANDRAVATESTTVPAVGAGTEYYLGGATSIPDSSPVSSLEIVVRTTSQSPKSKLSPAISGVLVQQARFDPGWVGAVVGEIENDAAAMLLTGTRISAVVFDSGGKVIGGAGGGTRVGQLPGVRAYFNASSSVGAIPFEQAASAGVSVLGSYQALR